MTKYLNIYELFFRLHSKEKLEKICVERESFYFGSLRIYYPSVNELTGAPQVEEIVVQNYDAKIPEEILEKNDFGEKTCRICAAVFIPQYPSEKNTETLSLHVNKFAMDRFILDYYKKKREEDKEMHEGSQKFSYKLEGLEGLENFPKEEIRVRPEKMGELIPVSMGPGLHPIIVRESDATVVSASEGNPTAVDISCNPPKSLDSVLEKANNKEETKKRRPGRPRKNPQTKKKGKK